MDSSSSDSRSDYEIRQFKFDELPDYAEISSFKPRGFKTPGGSYKISSWREAYRIFCRYLLKEKPRHLRAFKNLEETFLGRRVMFSNDPSLLNEAYQLRSGFYAEIFLPPKSIIHNISRLIQFCRLSPRQFVVSIPVYVDESELFEPEEVEDEQNEVESQLAEPEQLEEEVSEDETIQESVSTQPSSQIAHFTLDDDIPDLAFSKPVSITINTRRYSVSKWRDIVSETARYVYENDSESFLRYLYKNFGPKGNSRPLFSDKRSNLLQASGIDSNLYVETNFSSVDCVKKALLFIRYANIPQSKVQIEYLPAGAVNSDNPTPAESANINTEPEEELEDNGVVDNNASEQSQTETIKSDEDNDISRTDDSKPEEFKDDKEWDFTNDEDDFVDIGMEFTDDGLPVLSPAHQKLIDAIEEKFPKGIDIDNEDSIRTLELASGVPCNEYTLEDLRMILAYKKADNVFYVPLRLADESTVKSIAAFIDQNVDQYNAVSLSVIREKFQDQFDCECNDEELLEFIEWYVFSEMDRVVAIDYNDIIGDGVCLLRSITTDEFCENFYGRIESYLEKTDSPVPMSQLRQLYPSLNETIISYALSDDRFGSSIQEETKDEQLFYSIRLDSQRAGESDEETVSESEQEQERQSLSFTLDEPIPQLSFTKPCSIVFGNQRVRLSVWRDIISQTAIYIYQNEPDIFNLLVKQHGKWGVTRQLFSEDNNLFSPVKVNSKYYVETHASSIDAVKRCRLFLQSCKLPLSQVRIEYLPAASVKAQNNQPNSGGDLSQSDDNANSVHSQESEFEKLLNNLCESKPFITYDELMALANSASVSLESALGIALQKMVRVNKDQFVSLDLIHFDVDKIDRVLEGFVSSNDFIPFQDVYFFTSFPPSDSYKWNSFLLESYCRLFSKRFTVMVLTPNNENAGVIVRKPVKINDITTLLATAVKDSEIELTERSIEGFLLGGAYIAISDSSIIEKVIQRAKALEDENRTSSEFAYHDYLPDDSFDEDEDDDVEFDNDLVSDVSDEDVYDDATDESEQAPELHSLSFTLAAPVPDLKFTKPVAITIGDNRIELTLWREAITKTAEYLFENEPSFSSLVEEYGVKSKNRPLFSRNRSDLLQPYPIGSKLWVETKFDATDCVRKAKVFLGYCYIKLTKVRIEYIPGVANGSVGAPNLKTDNNRAPAQQQTLAELTKNPPEMTPELQKLLQIIQENFPQGVQLEISKNILENASGVQCTDEIVDDLKWFLFESVNVNGLFYLPSQIADESTLNDMAEFIDKQIKQHGAAATSVVREKFRYRLKFIISEDNEDLANFIDKQINPRLEQKVQIVYKENRKSKEKSKYSICLSESTSEKQFDKDVSLQIKQYLQERNCAAPMYELCNQFPHLDEAVLAYYLDEDENELLDDVFRVNYDGDEVSYYRTIDSLYLEDDFSEALTQAVAQLESNGGTATLATIGSKLDEYYNLKSEDGQSAFREQYDLTDDAAFRFVIQRCYAGEVNHRWGTKTRFVSEASTGSIKLYDEFKRLYPNCGVFHENKFFEFAKKKTGNYNTAALALAYLRPYCIRLDLDHWIDIQAFKEQSNFSPELADAIVERLTDQLGSRPFLSLGLLSNSFFEELPELRINDRLWQWNEYLLTSVSALLIDDLVIVNEEPNSNQVTALLLPASIPIPKDVIEYAVKCYKQQNGSNASIDGAVDFLKQNRIRMKKTAKLEQQLEELLKE